MTTMQALRNTSEIALAEAQARPEYALETAGYETDTEWDAFVTTTPGGHYTQSSAWARFRARHGWSMERVLVRRDGEIVAGAQCVYRTLAPFITAGIVLLGPVVRGDDPALADLVLGGVQEMARRHHIRYLIQQSPTGTQHEAVLLKRGFLRARLHEGIEPATTRLDLRQDLETILAHMHRTTRQHVRQSQKHALTFREGTDDDLPLFFEVYQRTSERKNFVQYRRQLIEEVWHEFSPAGFAKLFIVEADGVPVTAIMTLTYGESIASWKGGWTGEHAADHPNEFEYWSIATWGKAHNFTYLDFLGLDCTVACSWDVVEGRVSPDDIGSTLRSFKMGWGGGITYLSRTFIYIPNPLPRAAYRLMPVKANGDVPCAGPLLSWTRSPR